jgi:hypothetical protein
MPAHPSTPPETTKLEPALRLARTGSLHRGRPLPPRFRAPETATRPPSWPGFRVPARRDLESIAALRLVSAEAAFLLAAHRHLWCCRWRGADCFAIRHEGFAQVRRMDGRPFITADGTSLKMLNLPGSTGSFLNPGGPGAPDVPLLLTEGPVGLLESIEALLRADRAKDAWHATALMAAVSAGCRFTDSELRALAGRRVRILPDNDPAGRNAAETWARALRSARCRVECVGLPSGVKDLGDCLRTLPADDPFWGQLFDFGKRE